MKLDQKTNPFRTALWSVAKFLFSPGYREAIWVRFSGRAGLFQPYNVTRLDRYPEIFAWVRDALLGTPQPRLLSFGCSTGQEVLSLKHYIPQATVRGIDINKGNIAEARRRTAHFGKEISFLAAASTVSEPTAFYDAVFCLTVLQNIKLKNEAAKRCDHILPFAHFNETIADLARCVKPGGFLIVRNSNFRLCDADIAPQFETVFRLPHEKTPTPLFGRDNILMQGEIYEDTIFRKRETSTR